MKVFIYTFIFLLSCLLQSGLAQGNSNSDTTQTSESFASVSVDPVALSNSEFVVDFQSGWKNGYVMQRLGIDIPTLMFDYDASLIVPIEESGVSPYFGAGANIINFIVTAIGFDVHAGLEIKLIDEVAVFSEYETTFVLGGDILNNFKVGVNFYF